MNMTTFLGKFKSFQKKLLRMLKNKKKRLDNFDRKILQPQSSSQNITDQDMIFLKKEISRNSSTLISTKALTQEIADDSVKLRDLQL